MREARICPVCLTVHWRKGKCCSGECGVLYMAQVCAQLHAKKGPHYENWRRKWEAATGLKLKEGR
ncbi:unnamed protein product [marine sediment metagenome]|uniref:Uncharacterized protein n=1 Tax=marine sediment metagenome TaxID=412755 RepID=X0ZJ10_9ZZZZ